MLTILVLMLIALPLGEGTSLENPGWPSWRGPLSTGVAPGAKPPLLWSEDRNVRWKLRLPGVGHSTPVIWGDRVFLTTAIPFGERLDRKVVMRPGDHDNLVPNQMYRFSVLAVDRKQGELVWQKTVREGFPHESVHETGSYASNSPVTDGEHLIVSFGSNGLFGLDLDGELVWETELGRMHSKHGHGEGSSVVLAGGRVIVNFDHQGQSYVAAYDKRTGERLWKRDRDEVTSWATPIVVEHGGQHQVIVSGTGRVRAYDLETGEVVWECGGLSANVVASPVAADGMVYAASSYDTRALLAIRLEGASGDITGSEQVVWNRFRGTPYVPSPLLYGRTLYFLSHYQNVLSCVDVETGKNRHGPHRLEGIHNVYGSPVGSAGRVYITDLDGTTQVLSHSDELEVLATNHLDDSFSASAALIDGEFYLRGRHFLYCLAED